MKNGPNVVFVKAEHRSSRFQQSGNATVADLNSLRPAGRTRGIDHIGEVLGCYPDCEVFPALFGNDFPVGVQIYYLSSRIEDRESRIAIFDLRSCIFDQPFSQATLGQ